MTLLVPMGPAFFGTYMPTEIAAYAEDNIASGRGPREGALERARSEIESLLPLGLATPEHHFFEIRPTVDAPTIGALWFGIEERHGLRSAFVYNVGIDAAWRRQGHALRAFEALDSMVRKLGLSHIGLHVFGHNPGAQALYAKLGYGVTGLNMVKRLGETRG